MLMFQNSLLATFIPEFIMVIGYFLCLITPDFKIHSSADVQPTIEVHNTSYKHQQQQLSIYKPSIADFHIDTKLIAGINQLLPPFVENDTFLFFESQFFFSDDLSYINFSRPPPGFNA